MALCTNAQVQAHLGISETAASNTPAIVVTLLSTNGTSSFDQCAFSVASNVLTVTPNVSSGPGVAPSTFTLTNASYDTMGELATALDALSYLTAIRVCEDSSVPSTLISVENILSTLSPTAFTYANSTSDGASAFIDAKILEVQALAERYCGRVFDSASYDERLDGQGSETISLTHAPVTAISSITIIGPDGSVVETLSTDDYYLDSESGVIYSRSSDGGNAMDAFFERSGDGPATNRAPAYRWPYGTKNVRVQYTAGYTTIPYDLRLAAILCVCDLFYDRGNNRWVTTDSNQGRLVVRNPSAMAQVIAFYFDPWRRVV